MIFSPVNEEDGVMFLAVLTSEEDKQRFRKEMGEYPDFKWVSRPYHLMLGLSVRNTLRMGGFRYDHITMDAIWAPWLQKAVFLPDEELDPGKVAVYLTEYKANIEKYRSQRILDAR